MMDKQLDDFLWVIIKNVYIQTYIFIVLYISFIKSGH